MRSRSLRLGVMALAGAGLMALVPASALAATADLAISKSDGSDAYTAGSATVGNEFTYTITVTNLGPDTATGVEVRDNLPGRVDFISSSPSQGSCKGANNVTCELGTLASGATATVAIKVKARRAGQAVNTARVTTADTDPVDANNSASETTNITEAPVPTCKGQEGTIIGTFGDDTLTGTGKKDVFVALGGNDTILGLGGDDVVCAAGGNDTVKGAAGKDEIRLGGGDDVGKGGDGNDAIRGGGGADRLRGGAGADSLRGGAGPDSCRGGPGKDTQRGC